LVVFELKFSQRVRKYKIIWFKIVAVLVMVVVVVVAAAAAALSILV